MTTPQNQQQSSTRLIPVHSGTGTTAQKQQSSTRLIPVPEWNNHHTWPPIGGMRHLIFNAKTNGFAGAFKRVGRRILVDEAEFFASVDRQNQGGAK